MTGMRILLHQSFDNSYPCPLSQNPLSRDQTLIDVKAHIYDRSEESCSGLFRWP